MPKANGKANSRKVSKPQEKRKIRYAVVGLGYIAQVAVLPAFAHARKNSELAALVSGNPKKLKTLGRKYGVERLYDYSDFGDCLADIDAIYIALPNPMHRAYAVAAAEAGVHVLCEKPLGVTVADCEAMIEAARAGNVRLMTAYRLHFERANLRAREIARSGKLGELRFFSSAFSMQVRAGNIRVTDEDVGGGPLHDLGIYCLNAVRQLFDAEPEEVFAWKATRKEPRFEDSYEMLSAMLRFPKERLATFTASNGAADAGWYELVGTKGSICLGPAYEYAGELEMEVTIGGRSRTTKFARRDQFAPELLHFSDSILERRQPEPSGREGLADVRVIAALLESAERGRPVRLAPYEAASGPGMDQEMRLPPVRKPDLVEVQQPHPS